MTQTELYEKVYTVKPPSLSCPHMPSSSCPLPHSYYYFVSFLFDSWVRDPNCATAATQATALTGLDP